MKTLEQNRIEYREAHAALIAKSNELRNAKYPITIKSGKDEGKIRPNIPQRILDEVARLQGEWDALAARKSDLLDENKQLFKAQNEQLPKNLQTGTAPV